MSAAKKVLTLEGFAKSAGISFFECEPEWGGRVGYMQADYPNIKFCGYRSEKAAIEAWMADCFGPILAKALKAVLKPAKATGSAS